MTFKGYARSRRIRKRKLENFPFDKIEKIKLSITHTERNTEMQRKKETKKNGKHFNPLK